MTDIAIRVENLSKLYHIGKAQKRHDALRDALADILPRIQPRIARIARKEQLDIWKSRHELHELRDKNDSSQLCNYRQEKAQTRH